jgi:uncharacterized damage-inducible protein DinB
MSMVGKDPADPADISSPRYPEEEPIMTQKQMVTEKDMFLQRFEQECQITSKILKAYPANKAEFKPADKSRPARELAWTFVGEQRLADKALKGKIEMGTSPPAPTTFNEVIAEFEKQSKETLSKTSRASEDDLNRTVQFPVGPGKMGNFRAMDILWITLMDQIHHRGQLSVYLRLVGAKVPSIYGPTADETWM